PHVRRIRTSNIHTKSGLSLLDVKIHALLSYLANLSFFLLLKVDGARVEEHPAVDRMIEARTVLEKLRPLETKLRYQIEKLVKAATAALESAAAGGAPEAVDSTGFADPLAFKPNPLAMEAAAEPDPEPAPRGASAPAKYKAPRVAPQFFDDGSSKKKKLGARERERAARSRLMRDVRAQFENVPEELSAGGTGYSAVEMATEMDERMAERDRFEEDNFVRLNMSKRERKEREKLAASGGMSRFRNEFDTFDDFADIEGLEAGPPKGGSGGKRKAKDFFGKGGGGKGGGPRKRSKR
ncbi:hypothetical protein DFJ74DRAFT_607266, partial [Hyaloraphidium curvatum]